MDILTLFPRMFEGPLSESLIGKARAQGLVDLRIHNLRDFSNDPHRKVDDRPYGGGPGMVMRVEPIFRALRHLRTVRHVPRQVDPFIVYLTPQGQTLTQAHAQRLSEKPWLVLLCGHYEGIDERLSSFIDEEVSIGDYVLTGGEIPALVVADAVLRLVPGVVQEPESLHQESFATDLLDFPQYTRPRRWRGQGVPKVLLSGDHEAVRRWRMKEALRATWRKRPDLLSVSR